MAYSGWLVKVGDPETGYIIDSKKFIKAESYSAYVNSQALDPWTDANGYEHIEYVDLEALKVEFETPAMLTDDEYWELMGNIRSRLFSKRKCIVTAYIPELHRYVTQTCYLVDSQSQIYGNYERTIKYNPVRIAFVGGVYNGG